jgi:hypothetical protein
MSDKCVVCNEPARFYIAGTDRCPKCRNLFISEIFDFAAGTRKNLKGSNHIWRYPWTDENWFLIPNVVRRLNGVGRPPRMRILKDCGVPKGSQRNIVKTHIPSITGVDIKISSSPLMFRYPTAVTKRTIEIFLPRRANIPPVESPTVLKPNCKCNNCGGPAFKLLFSVECLSKCKGE